MDDENLDNILKKVEILIKKVDKNTEIVKDLRSHNRWVFFFRVLYYGTLIALAFGAWYFIQPVIDSISSTMNMVSQTGNDISNSLDSVKDLTDSADGIMGLFDIFNKN